MYYTRDDYSFCINFQLCQAETIEGINFQFIVFLLRLINAALPNYRAPPWRDKEREEAVQSAQTSPPVICASCRSVFVGFAALIVFGAVGISSFSQS